MVLSATDFFFCFEFHTTPRFLVVVVVINKLRCIHVTTKKKTKTKNLTLLVGTTVIRPDTESEKEGRSLRDHRADECILTGLHEAVRQGSYTRKHRGVKLAAMSQ